MENQKKQMFFSKDRIGLKNLSSEITVSVTVDIGDHKTFPRGFVDKDKLDATTESQIRRHQKEDDDQARLDAVIKNA